MVLKVFFCLTCNKLICYGYKSRTRRGYGRVQPSTTPNQDESETFDMAGRILLCFYLLLGFSHTTRAQWTPEIEKAVNTAWMRSLVTHQEEAFMVDAIPPALVIVWVKGGTRLEATVKLGPRTLEVFHTHPERHEAQPSRADVKFAVANSVTNYVISMRAIWRVNPDGRVEKFRDR